MRIVLAFLLLLVAAPLAAAPLAQSFPESALEIKTAGGQSFRFRVQLALTNDQQAQGLMFRPHLADDAGMLFVNRDSREMSMWMKNTIIPLDMLFIAADGKIVNIAENAKPESLDTISSKGPVKGVLELAGGTAKKLGIRPGDQIVSADLNRG